MLQGQFAFDLNCCIRFIFETSEGRVCNLFKVVKLDQRLELCKHVQQNPSRLPHIPVHVDEHLFVKLFSFEQLVKSSLLINS